MFVLILFLVVIGEIIIRAVVNSHSEDSKAGWLAGGCFDLAIGTFLYEIARQNIEYDGYFYELEDWHYYLGYFGLLLAMFGVASIIWIFYKVLKEKNKE